MSMYFTDNYFHAQKKNLRNYDNAQNPAQKGLGCD